LDNFVWRQVLPGSDDDRGTFSDGSETGIVGLPPAFVNLCDLDEHSTNENNEYHYILRLLTPLLRLKADPENFAALMAFCGRTLPTLRPLVLSRDPIALLLLSYWFALTAQIDQWWLTQRARSECMAIVQYLSGLGNPKITALLPFPASFGQASLSYIWIASSPDSAPLVLERHTRTGVNQPPPNSPPSSTLTLLQS